MYIYAKTLLISSFAVVAVCGTTALPVEVEDEELASVMGKGLNEYMCGQCLDMCVDSGMTQLQLASYCFFSTPTLGCVFYMGQATEEDCLAAGVIVHDGLGLSVHWCAYDSSGTGEEFLCRKAEPSYKKECGTIDSCWCNESADAGNGTCELVTDFYLEDADECNPLQ